jgi:NAD-dependent DNA ligase
VFTGVRAKDLEEMIVDQGGTIGGAVNSKTTILVCKDPAGGSSKLKKAADMGVRIVGIDDFRGEF